MAKNRQAGSSASDAARLTVRGDLREHLDAFVKGASEEEIRFMNEVMGWWASGHGPTDRNDPELGIASAFQYVIDGSDARFVRVECGDAKRFGDALETLLARGATGVSLAPGGDGWHLWKNPRQEAV